MAGIAVTNWVVRTLLVIGVVALLLAAQAAGADWSPSPDWLAQARCVHAKEGRWSANSGNGFFGGLQFSAGTWRSVGGKPDLAFNHPGDSSYPFSASPTEQLYRAWVLWKNDGGTWRSWGAVGAACSRA
jgi:Transglycosylase-like domain